MRILTTLLIMASILLPSLKAMPSRSTTLNDLVGIYSPSGLDTEAPWIQIARSEDGRNLDIFLIERSLNSRIKILSSATGQSEGPVWMQPQQILDYSGEPLTQGVIASITAPTPAGFILVQSQVSKDTSLPFAGSDTISFSRIERELGALLEIKWKSVRFSKQSLAQGQTHKSWQSQTYQKLAEI